MNYRYASLFAFVLLGCGTTDSDTDTDSPSGEPHFAYLESANPAVVVAGTTRSGEGLVILTPLGNGGIGRNGIGGIAYRSVNGSTLTIRLGSDGLPASAHGNGFIVLFQNYRDGFVDLAYMAQDGRTAVVRNVAMPSNLQVPNAVAPNIGSTMAADVLLSTRIRWASVALSAVACGIDLTIGAASVVVGGVAIPGAVLACASAGFKAIALLPGQEWASVASASVGGMSCAVGAVAGCANFILSQGVGAIANTVAVEEARRAEIAVARGNLGSGAGGVPAVPPLLLAEAVSSSRIDLRWGDVSGETAYDLERCIGLSVCLTFTPLVSLPANSTSYQHIGLAAGTGMRYRIKARNAAGSSEYSNATWAMTLATGGGGGGAPSGIGFGDEQFALIPAGTFQMGSTNGLSDEVPVHSVTLTNSFRMQKTEVTQGQWRQVMGTSPSAFSSCGDNCPVESVSWDDVQRFLVVLNQQNPGKGYRLPSEAEWEYAARAGTTGDYNVTGQPVEALGWVFGYSSGRTWPVAQKVSNLFGIFDMHGNVWEWVQDWYSDSYYSIGVSQNPTGPANGSFRVLRGGSWYTVPGEARSAMRFGMPILYRDNTIGFRLVRNP